MALNPTGYDGKFDAIANYQWLYILYVLVTLAFGVMMVRAVILLIKGRDNAYRYSMIALIGTTVVGVIHIITSRALRGGSMPVDGVVYATFLTLIVVPTLYSLFYGVQQYREGLQKCVENILYKMNGVSSQGG